MEPTAEETEEDLKQLREWLVKMPNIVQDYDNKFLTGFLKGCKNLQKTKTALENFNNLGMRYPEFFGTYDPLHWELQEHLSVTPIFLLPQKINDDTSGIMVGSNALITKMDPYQKHPLELLRYWLMTIYIYLWENNFREGKWIFICECKNGTLTEMRDVTPIAIKNIVEVLENCFPVRVKGIHFINVPPFMEFFLDVIKSVTKKKLAERIHVHSKLETLYDYVPKKVLPEEYGGCEEAGVVLSERWKKKVERYRRKFLEEEFKMRRLDEYRSVIDDTCELVGTFRKLNVY